MWCRNFPLRAFSDTRTEIISNRVISILLHCYLEAYFEEKKQTYRNYQILVDDEQVFWSKFDLQIHALDVKVVDLKNNRIN